MDEPRTNALVADLILHMQPRITRVETVEAAREVIETGDCDLIIADQYLADGRGLDLVARDGSLDTPIILLKETIEADRILTALRLGVADILAHPVDSDMLIERIGEVLHEDAIRRRDARRARRLRKMSSKLIRERRELRQRVDLICNDIVVAYRQLAEKVVESPLWPADEDQPHQRV
jgi:DNA-binding NtrC family response regulator